jgi:uncharacterized membrane protein YedE/YeeE
VKRLTWAFLWGAVFGAGLIVSGMTQPGKVVGFLDVAGDWDPSLAFVMVGAILVHALTRRWVLGRTRPVLFPSFSVLPVARVDRWLLIGSALFGLGWGIAGYCPGPAIVATGSGSIDALIITVAMALGIKVADGLMARGDPSIPDPRSVRHGSLEV